MAITADEFKQAFELVVHQGMQIKDVAKILDISHSALLARLHRNAAYLEHLDKKYNELEAKKQQARLMIQKGMKPKEVAKQLGFNRTAVTRWAREVGINTKHIPTSNLTCPACKGIMKKQDLYFWICDCGAEWWPAEEHLPESLDDWAAPYRVIDGESTILEIITRMIEQGHTNREICTHLNENGYYSPTGKEWEKCNFTQFLLRRGFRRSHSDRELVEKIIKDMALAGHMAKTIVERLRAEGLTSTQGTDWCISAITRLCRQWGIKLQGKSGKGRKPTGGKHPWRLDESARIASVKHAHGWGDKNDLPSM